MALSTHCRVSCGHWFIKASFIKVSWWPSDLMVANYNASHVHCMVTYPLVMTNSLLLKMAIEIVSFPIKNGGSFHNYVSLPEGIKINNNSLRIVHGMWLKKKNHCQTRRWWMLHIISQGVSEHEVPPNPTWWNWSVSLVNGHDWGYTMIYLIFRHTQWSYHYYPRSHNITLLSVIFLIPPYTVVDGFFHSSSRYAFHPITYPFIDR